MVTITDSNPRSTVFETVYDIINTDKSLYGASLSPSWVPTIYGGMPELDTITYPAIIILPVTINENELTVDTTRTSSTKTITVNAVLFAKKNKDLDYLSDGVTNSIRINTSGIYLTEISESSNVIYPNEQKIRSKTINFTFMRR
jgi:hypothetical protein